MLKIKSHICILFHFDLSEWHILFTLFRPGNSAILSWSNYCLFPVNMPINNPFKFSVNTRAPHDTDYICLRTYYFGIWWKVDEFQVHHNIQVLAVSSAAHATDTNKLCFILRKGYAEIFFSRDDVTFLQTHALILTCKKPYPTIPTHLFSNTPLSTDFSLLRELVQ